MLDSLERDWFVCFVYDCHTTTNLMEVFPSMKLKNSYVV